MKLLAIVVVALAALRVAPASGASIPVCTSEQLAAAASSKEEAAWEVECDTPLGMDPNAMAEKMCTASCQDAWAKMVASRPQCLQYGQDLVDYQAKAKRGFEQISSSCGNLHPEASGANATAASTPAPSSSAIVSETTTTAPVTTAPASSSLGGIATTAAPATTAPPSSSAVGVATASATALSLAVAIATAQI